MTTKRDIFGPARLSGVALLAALAVTTQATARPVQEPNEPTVQDATQSAIGFTLADQTLTAIGQHLSPLRNAFSLPGAPGAAGTVSSSGSHVSTQGKASPLAGWSGWSSLSLAASKNTFAPTQTKGSSQTLSFGIGKPVDDTITAGVMVSLNHDKTTTVYNSGSIETSGVMLAPYASVKLNDVLSLDLSGGVGLGHAKQTRAPFGPVITGEFENTTVFGSATLNASKWSGLWFTSGKLGMNASHTKRSAFTESDATFNAAKGSTLVQASLGGSVGYWMDPMLIYLDGSYVYDLKHPAPTAIGASNDRDELRVALGMQINGTGKWQGVSGGASLSHTFLRSQQSGTSIDFSIRMEF